MFSLLRNVLSKILRSMFSLYYYLHLVAFASSTWNLSLEVFEVFSFFMTVSVKILRDIVLARNDFSWFQESEKVFDYLSNRVVFLCRLFHEKFKFLKSCPYDLLKFLHSYYWNVRNRAKNSPKMTKKQSFFSFFSIFSRTVHAIQTKFFTVVLHHNIVLYVQFH